MGRTELTSVTNFALTIRMGEKYDSIGSLAYEPTCNPLASLLTRGYRLLRTAPVSEPRCGAGWPGSIRKPVTDGFKILNALQSQFLYCLMKE